MTEVTRRSVVRAGAVSAWSAPLVLASVPAYASTCSPGVFTTLSVTQTGDLEYFFNGDGSYGGSLPVQVCNTSSIPLDSLSATFERLGAPVNTVSFQVGAWPAWTTADGAPVQVTAPAGTSIAPGACATYTVTFGIKNIATSQQLRVTFLDGCGGSGSVTFPYET